MNPKTAGDLHRRISLEEFDGLCSLFHYHLDEDRFAAFRREFVSQKNNAA
jgi:hypothetical protein